MFPKITEICDDFSGEQIKRPTMFLNTNKKTIIIKNYEIFLKFDMKDSKSYFKYFCEIF